MFGFLKSKLEHPQLTEGELIIEEFFRDEGIESRRQVVIPDLKGDSKQIRRADFYLPGYKVYVEFLGKWRSKEHQDAYRKKMRVYRANDVPCVYLWPDNLGSLQYIFPMRLKKELRRYNPWGLLRYICRKHVMGLVAPLVVAFFVFREILTPLQAVGFVILILWWWIHTIRVVVRDWFETKSLLENNQTGNGNVNSRA